MKALSFEIDLLSPVLLAQLNRNDPNSRISFNYLPGSVLRGMLIEQYRRNHPTLAADGAFRRLFLDGTVRFLHAYPQAPQAFGRRMLPTPLSWKQEKDLAGADEEPLFDFAIQKEGSEPDKTRIWQNINAPFSAILPDKRYIVKSPQIQVNIHNARGDRRHPTDGDNSTVFRYDALAPDQTFCGWVLAEEEQELLTIAELFQAAPTMIIGRSHSAGYGRIRARVNLQTESKWQEYMPTDPENEKESNKESAKLVVTLLSDAVLRDPATGAYATDLSPILPDHCPEVAYSRAGIAGGFNRTGNLPLCQVQTIQAGSVFVYKQEAGLVKQLEELITSGIGERQAEGFGRLAVNWQGPPQLSALKQQSNRVSEPIVLGGQSITMASNMLERMLRTKLDEKLLERINCYRLTHNSMTNSQLSRLRTAARACLEQKSAQGLPLEPLETLLDKMKPTARQQYQNTVIERIDITKKNTEQGDTEKKDTEKKDFETWFKEQLELDMAGAFWCQWKIDPEKLPTIGGQRAKLDEKLAREYTIRFIDGVAKQARKGGEHEGQ